MNRVETSYAFFWGLHNCGVENSDLLPGPSTLKMKANCFFETPVTAHPKTWFCLSEDSVPQQYVFYFVKTGKYTTGWRKGDKLLNGQSVPNLWIKFKRFGEVEPINFYRSCKDCSTRYIRNFENLKKKLPFFKPWSLMFAWRYSSAHS